MSKDYIESKRKEFEIDDNGFIGKPVEYCNMFVGEFLQEKNIELQELQEFPFGKLYDNEKYGSDGDADRGELVKIIHFFSYSKCLEENKDLAKKVKLKLKVEAPWKWGKHEEKNIHTIFFNEIPLDSGDTLNTFATLFSRACENSLDDRLYNGYDKIYKKFEFDDEKLIDFHKKFQCIGNFMLLPYSKDYSINKYRAGWENEAGWYDYCDLYLSEVRKYIEKPEDVSENFKKLIESDNNNDKYFQAFERFADFVKFNNLQDFFTNDKYEKTKQLCLNGKPYYHWMKNINNEEYKKFADNYVEIATEIINKRSERLINFLKPSK